MTKVLFILIALFPALAWAQPAINFYTETHDFGNVTQGDQLEYAFELSNVGTEELVIGKVHTS
jgi:hypothetical protein